jgi:hypothetical protein
MHQLTELSNRVIVFFDRAEYYLVRGYTEAMHKKLKESGKVSEEELDKVFFEDSFYNA